MPLSKDRIWYDFDPFDMFPDIKVRPGQRDAAKDEIAQFVKDQVLLDVGNGRSPVEGGEWKRKLSAEYAKRKAAEGGSNFANLELTGDMLDALDVVNGRGSKLRLQVEGKEQVAKADGHNNFSGDSTLPGRHFIPNADEDETFKARIRAGIRSILENYAEED